MTVHIGPYTIVRGAIIPYEINSQSEQDAEVDGAGGVVVSERPYAEQFMKAMILGTVEEIAAVRGFIENGVRFRAVPFNFVDDWNNTHLVRYWSGVATQKFIAPGICEMELLLRKEI
jgi:hypothetical protein